MKFTVPKPPKEARQIITALRRSTRPVRTWDHEGRCTKKGDEKCPMGLHPLATSSAPVSAKRFGVPTVKDSAVVKFYDWWDTLGNHLVDSNGQRILGVVNNVIIKQAYRRASYMIWPTKKGR